MSWTTGQVPAQVLTVLQSAGAKPDQAASALYSLAWTKNQPRVLWGVLVQCTTGWNDGSPQFQYTASPTMASTSQTLAQARTALVAAGARSEQADQVLHNMAWTPGQSRTHWGVIVQCTSGWNSTSSPVFSFNTSPS